MNKTFAPARRSLLAALFAAPVVAAAPALAARAAATESPDLIALGGRLAGLGDALMASVVAYDGAKLAYEQARPALPAELLATPGDRFFNRMAEEMEVPGGETKNVYVSRPVRAEIILRDISRHTKEGKRLRRIARIAKVYEDAERAAYKASNCERLFDELDARGDDYLKAVEELGQHEPATMRGAWIFARAMALVPVALAAQGHTPAVGPEVVFARKLAAAITRVEAAHG